jgi:hypothetical protein
MGSRLKALGAQQSGSDFQQNQRSDRTKSWQMKKSVVVQMPSHHELRVGQIEPASSRSLHPIRQSFGAPEAHWIRH